MSATSLHSHDGELVERVVRVNGDACRVWEKGSGEPVGFLAGLGGLPRWSPFLDRLAQSRRVIAPSLPGFPGATGHDRLDDLLDWVAATLDLLEAAGLRGADLVACSVGATLAAEAVACSPGLARRLVLIAPFGLFDGERPVADAWAMPPGRIQHLSKQPAAFSARFAPPAGQESIEWQVTTARASEAAARILWPTTDTGLARRLHRVRVPARVLWGADDTLIPSSYAKDFTALLGGPAEVRLIEGAAHLAELDAPDRCAEEVLAFLSAT